MHTEGETPSLSFVLSTIIHWSTILMPLRIFHIQDSCCSLPLSLCPLAKVKSRLSTPERTPMINNVNICNQGRLQTELFSFSWPNDIEYCLVFSMWPKFLSVINNVPKTFYTQIKLIQGKQGVHHERNYSYLLVSAQDLAEYED